MKPNSFKNNSGLMSREVSLEILTSVLEKEIPLDSAITNSKKITKLSTRDRSFSRLLVTTVLRRLGQIDAAIDESLRRKLTKNQSVVRNSMRLGIAQLVFLRTAPHAAINSSVQLVKNNRRSGMAGLVNAVLHKINIDGSLALQKSSEAEQLNTPCWLQKSWEKAYGTIITKAIMSSHLDEPPLDFTIAQHKTAKEWAKRLNGILLDTGSVRRYSGGLVKELDGYDEGAWWVQDTAASIPAKLFGNLKGQTAIDLCAAPGGKTAQLAAAGAKVVAVDISEDRLELLKDNLDRLNLNATIINSDVLDLGSNRLYDCILLDAPCTATGTIRRHPDINWLKKRNDLKSAMNTQSDLIRAAISMLAPGGRLIYSVCSLQPEEGPAQIEKIINDFKGIMRLPVTKDEIAGIKNQDPSILNTKGDIQTLPCHFNEIGGVDGFFISRLVKL
tara:strand:- start:5565 stop:6896 length:1332 start_codon:yes stop_codon:yes gene_type:complete